MVMRPVVLMILDGMGLCPNRRGNAVAMAGTPNLDRLRGEYPATVLTAAGEAVGLVPGQMGDSNVGHLNLGAGRIVYQDLARLSQAVADGSFFRNEVLTGAINTAAVAGTALHLIGLLSDGGVHSHLTHLYALIALAAKAGIKQVCIHAFLDGRDVGPTSAGEYIDALTEKLAEIGTGTIASVMGRYYPMDRDQRWDRVAAAFRALVQGGGRRAASARQALAEAYARGETDEFVAPTVIVDAAGEPYGMIQPQDTVVFFNFRADRAREISHALADRVFTGFARPADFTPRQLITLTQYAADLPAAVAFPPQDLRNTLGEVVSRAGIAQLRIAETEKYAHVTFFFNGGVEAPFPGEERVLIPSPPVATYDLAPEMSAPQVCDRVCAELAAGKYGLYVVNFANLDMVGHTGNLPAAMRAVTVVDDCVGRVAAAVLAQGGAMLVVADHGNVEQMVDYGSGEPFTAHTGNQVQGMLIDPRRRQAVLRPGILADVAPTVLELLGLPQPAEMTGRSLLQREG